MANAFKGLESHFFQNPLFIGYFCRAMAELDGKKSAANNIFGIFRRISKKDKEKETVKSPKIKQEMMQGQTALKRKISSKRSLAIPPFEASLDWDTGRLFMPPEDEHIGRYN
uniref:Uncharacterized protein n=1 Tax=Romanomermis culicivorax TaxID=13658 RepID=A0A915JV72_ROMCU